ncbi:efflux RND transporter periplasmic adaptor subunit [Chitinilyticum litopenaei]|uniref:efflux RND transporter periplasmic adaptor subunit n=1 Tax=Chitinilyticum litopenaei TaxID=1121276 RepID=UPI0006886AFB|nr:efflux RND transporter periplasmic adaptor subunit [Chitinilyticum litopenaei]
MPNTRSSSFSLRSRRTLLIVLIAAGAGLAALVLALRPGTPAGSDKAAASQPAAQPKPALTVELITPEQVSWPQLVKANGNVSAWQESRIGSEIGGLRLVEVSAQVGDRVQRGQVLARFNDETVRAELAQAQAALSEAQAGFAEARQNADRVRQLGNKGALSEQQITQALTQEQTASARVKSAEAQLKTMQARLEQTRIKAPDDGVISQRDASLGDIGQQGQELFRLVRQGRIEWRAEVTAADSSTLRPGQSASITTPDGKTVAGKVRMVAPTADPQTRNILVYVDLEAGASAKPGMFARGEIATGDAAALVLPGSAVLLRDGFASVFTVTPEQRVKQLRVTLGRQQGERIEVRGLPAGTRVVASGGGFLADGDVVRVKP